MEHQTHRNRFSCASVAHDESSSDGGIHHVEEQGPDQNDTLERELEVEVQND